MGSTSNKRGTQFDLRVLQTGFPNQQKMNEDVSDGGNIPEHTNTRAFTKELSGRQNTNSVDPMTGLLDLTLPNAVKSGVRAHQYVATKHMSPWRSYEQIYTLRLGVGDWVSVAQSSNPLVSDSARRERKNPLSNLVVIRRFSGPDTESKLRRFERIRHANFASALEFFAFEGDSYVVFEYMSISLSYIAGNPFLNEIRLAAILGQELFLDLDSWAVC